MEYYSAIKKNTFESILMRWMKLEPIIQSEVSQKEKHQYIPVQGAWVQSLLREVDPAERAVGCSRVTSGQRVLN